MYWCSPSIHQTATLDALADDSNIPVSCQLRLHVSSLYIYHFPFCFNYCTSFSHICSFIAIKSFHATAIIIIIIITNVKERPICLLATAFTLSHIHKNSFSYFDPIHCINSYSCYCRIPSTCIDVTSILFVIK